MTPRQRLVAALGVFSYGMLGVSLHLLTLTVLAGLRWWSIAMVIVCGFWAGFLRCAHQDPDGRAEQ